jgi:transposase-like protein
MRERAGELVAGARDEGVALTEDGGLTSMVREVLQAGLDVEMTEHRGYQRYGHDRRGTRNSRNGGYRRR